MKNSSKNFLAINTAEEAQISSIMARMELSEKIGQMHQLSWQFFSKDQNWEQIIREGRIGALLSVRDRDTVNRLQKIATEESRLGIPLLIGDDVIHGLRTVFPIPLGEAASFNPELMEASARVAAKEALASGTHWTFAPMIDIALDSRWGRIAEGAGEDVYLGKIAAAARVRGFQTENAIPGHTMVSCPKHFAAYGAMEGGLDYYHAEVSEARMRDVYLPPFKAALEAGAGTLMSAYHTLNGIPASGHQWLYQQILYGEWDFQGLVVSDWNAIYQLIDQGMAADKSEAVEIALKTGLHLDMQSFGYLNKLAELLQNKRIDPSLIDDAVRRILRIKIKLGLFERPFVSSEHSQVILCVEHRELARKSAQQSIVLLKNESNILPLKPRQKLAIIGALAKEAGEMLGTWNTCGLAEDAITLWQALESRQEHSPLQAESIRYAQAYELPKANYASDSIPELNQELLAEAIKVAEQSDIILFAAGEPCSWSGEAHCRTDLNLPKPQQAVLQALMKTGKPIVLLVFAGRALSLEWESENLASILYCWHPGIEAGNAILDILEGSINPSGRLPITLPRHVGQMPLYYHQRLPGRSRDNGGNHTRYVDRATYELYPFGFGLSYSQVKYKELQISKSRISAKVDSNEWLEIRAEIVNESNRDCVEVVQLYVHDVAASIPRPRRELKGFQRINLEPGEKRQLVFRLKSSDLGFHNSQGIYITEPGQFQVWIAPDSRLGLKGEFWLD